MSLQAYYNHGRWMADCPICGNPFELLDGGTLICSHCWPGLRAVKFVTDEYGALVQAPHTDKIFDTRAAAVEAGQEYEVEYPAERVAIEAALRPRPVENMNWYPGETVEDLIAENIEHGLEAA